MVKDARARRCGEVSHHKGGGPHQRLGDHGAPRCEAPECAVVRLPGAGAPPECAAVMLPGAGAPP
eukprot:4193243-Heterocapsa_arctica.AAC.1